MHRVRGGDLPWTGIPSGGSRNTPWRFMLQKLRSAPVIWATDLAWKLDFTSTLPKKLLRTSSFQRHKHGATESKKHYGKHHTKASDIAVDDPSKSLGIQTRGSTKQKLRKSALDDGIILVGAVYVEFAHKKFAPDTNLSRLMKDN